MDLKELQKNWDEFAKTDPLHAIYRPDEKGKKWDLEEFFKLGEKEIRAVMKDLESLQVQVTFSRTRALDFGCGVGRLTQALAAYFKEVVGLDIAPAMIELARKYNRYPDQCRYVLNDANDLKFLSDNSFDFIYSNITLQHMEPRYSENYLKEFMRILTPGGFVIFQLPSERKMNPNEKSLLRKLRRRLRSLVPKPWLDVYYRTKGVLPENASPPGAPQMEMYAVSKETVTEILEKNSGHILQVLKNENSGPHWVSLRYCVTKIHKL